MDVIARIAEDYKKAFKAKDSLQVDVLRMLRAQIKNREIEKRGELDDQELIAVVRMSIKQRNEAAEAYQKAGDQQRANRELAEIDVLKTYLPPELDEAELDRLIHEAINETDAQGMGDLGKVMKSVMPKLAGRADGKTVNEKVRRALSA